MQEKLRHLCRPGGGTNLFSRASRSSHQRAKSFGLHPGPDHTYSQAPGRMGAHVDRPRLNSKKKELPSIWGWEVRLRKMMTETQGWRKERKEKRRK